MIVIRKKKVKRSRRTQERTKEGGSLERNAIRWPRKTKNGEQKRAKKKQNEKNGKEEILKNEIKNKSE